MSIYGCLFRKNCISPSAVEYGRIGEGQCIGQNKICTINENQGRTTVCLGKVYISPTGIILLCELQSLVVSVTVCSTCEAFPVKTHGPLTVSLPLTTTTRTPVSEPEDIFILMKKFPESFETTA